MDFSEQRLLIKYFCELREGMLVDVGAHNGAFAWPFARRGWSVLAFEPELQNFRALKRGFRYLRGVVCIRKAVSDVTEKEVPFYVSREHHGIHALRPFHPTHKKEYLVDTIRMDDALRELKIRAVNLLKIDIEGADFLALQSFDFKIYRPEAVMVEFMDERSRNLFGYSHHDVVEFMNRIGYSAFVSEWAPIVEYARKGEKNQQHRWIQCRPYPIDHAPAWGNLLFVPAVNQEDFERFLVDYLKSPPSNEKRRFGLLRSFSNSMPGSRAALNILLNLSRTR